MDCVCVCFSELLFFIEQAWTSICRKANYPFVTRKNCCAIRSVHVLFYFKPKNLLFQYIQYFLQLKTECKLDQFQNYFHIIISNLFFLVFCILFQFFIYETLWTKTVILKMYFVSNANNCMFWVLWILKAVLFGFWLLGGSNTWKPSFSYG